MMAGWEVNDHEDLSLPLALLCLTVSGEWALAAETKPTAQANEEVEWSVISRKDQRDPFNEADVDFVMTTPDNQRLRLPAFWAGGQTCAWTLLPRRRWGFIAFAPQCSDSSNAGLHGVEGQVEIMPIISGEARYEALEIGRRLDATDARQAFWAHLINGGCAGHTYARTASAVGSAVISRRGLGLTEIAGRVCMRAMGRP